MAYVIASEGLQDQAYCDRYVLGFDEDHLPPDAPAGGSYRAYLLGLADGVRKTPEWAAGDHGSPGGDDPATGRRVRHVKPAALQCGYAPGRTAYGEQFHRAAYALAAITGNVGVAGGNSGTSNGATDAPRVKRFPAGANPIAARVSLAAARRPPDARAGGRLPRRHQDDLLGGGRPLQPVPQREQDRGGPGPASSSSWSRTTSSPRPPATPTSCCPPRRSGSATTCTRRGRARATTRSS